MTPETDDLTTRLRLLGETAAVPPDSRARVGGALLRGRRNRRLAVAGASVAAAAVVVGSVAIAGQPDGGGPPPATDRGTNGIVDTDSAWQPIATSPLQAVHGTVSAWTGTEMLVIGGEPGPPCPPDADCVFPEDGLTAAGAAYDPATDTWRTIHAAPDGFAYATSLWIDDQLIVFENDGPVLSYDPKADDWRTVSDDVPDNHGQCNTWTGADIVCTQSEEHARDNDWLLDPVTGDWTALPDDPFPPTFDRSFTWSGDTLYFTALLTSGVNTDAPDLYRLASYDLGSQEWTRLAASTVGFGDPRWHWFDDRLVNPAQASQMGLSADSPAPGGQYDPATNTWSDIAQADLTYDELSAGCQLPAIGPAGDWLIGGGPVLVSTDPSTTTVAPGCPLVQPDAAAWTGDSIVVWGGPSNDYRDNTADGYTWTPPPPA